MIDILTQEKVMTKNLCICPEACLKVGASDFPANFALLNI